MARDAANVIDATGVVNSEVDDLGVSWVKQHVDVQFLDREIVIQSAIVAQGQAQRAG